MAKERKEDDVSKLAFEEAINELTKIVDRMDKGTIPLQDSLYEYERGMNLIRHCRSILKKAEQRIEKISKEEMTEDRGRQTEPRP